MKHNEVEMETVYDEMPKSLTKSRSRRRLSISFKNKRVSKMVYITPLSKILEFHPLEVARQLTLLESNYFVQIQPRECLNQCWSKDKANAPNMLALIERFNMVRFLPCISVANMSISVEYIHQNRDPQDRGYKATSEGDRVLAASGCTL